MIRAGLLLLLVAFLAGTEEYQGYYGRWVEVVATAYSPHDKRDSSYHATKGRDRWMTAGRVSDVRRVPHGVAAPQPGGKRPLASFLTIPLRTQVIIPLGSGYLEKDHRHDTPEERVFLVDDTGSDITQNTRDTGRLHIDLRMTTESDAFAYNQGQGRHRFRIFVISGKVPPPPPPPVVIPPPVPVDIQPLMMIPPQRPFAPPAPVREEGSILADATVLSLAMLVFLGWLHLLLNWRRA